MSEDAPSVSSIKTGAKQSAWCEAVRGPYIFGTREPLPEEVANRLVQILAHGSGAPAPGILGGRTRGWREDVPGLSSVFIKRYAHGGILRSVTAARFLALGECRSMQEFVMLERVRGLGISAPKPLIYVKKGAIVYSTWLIMEEIRDTRTLVEISESDPDSLQGLMKSLGEQLFTLIRNRVLHVDFHPGNVIVSKSSQVYIVDFDKAHIFRGSAIELREIYLRRWRRAIIKHSLSPVLTELMSFTLRGYNE